MNNLKLNVCKRSGRKTKNMIYGYSERGIFNSIIYYLDANKNLIGEFLKVLGVEGFTEKEHTFTFLNEQSFSDFGDNDLTIVIDEETENKTVVFVEGKVKTFSGNFDLNSQLQKIKTDKQYKGVSSNIFAQLYYKYLLAKKMEKGQSESCIGKSPKKLGSNPIVKKGYEKIADAQRYYYTAILPNDITTEDFQKMFSTLDIEMNIDNVRCAYWGKIQDFFTGKNAISVIENFKYNEEATGKKGKAISQIYQI